MPTEQLPRGSNLQLFIGKQSAFKTPAAGDYLTTFAYSFGMAESRPYQDDPILGTLRQNDRDATEPSQDVASFAGPIVVPLDFSHLRYWLELLLGAPSTSGSPRSSPWGGAVPWRRSPRSSISSTSRTSWASPTATTRATRTCWPGTPRIPRAPAS